MVNTALRLAAEQWAPCWADTGPRTAFASVVRAALTVADQGLPRAGGTGADG